MKPLEVVKSQPELSDFEMFWECVPRKKAKLDALKAWKQTESLRPPIEEIIAALETQVRAYNTREDPDFVYFPYPATWLRRGQWEDG